MTIERAAGYIHPDDRETAWEAIRRAIRDREPYEWCLRVVREDGITIAAQSRGRATYDEAGKPLRMVGTMQDVTERVRNEEAVRASREGLAADLAGMKRLQQVSTRLVKDDDSTGLLSEIVDTAIDLTAADMGNIQLLDRVSDTLRIVASRGFRPEDQEVFRAIRRGESISGTALERGGRVVVEDVTASSIFAGKPILDAVLSAGIRAAQSTPLICRDGRLVGMLSTHYRTPHLPSEQDLHLLDLLARQAADWIERTRAEGEVRRARDELDRRVRERTAELNDALAALERQERLRTELLRRVVTVQEEERRRISRELHDEMGQHLTALMLRLQLVKDSVGEDAVVREQLRWLEDAAARIGRDVHRIALELRPTALDDLGLPAALANYAEAWSRRSGVAAEVRVGGLEAQRLPSDVETTVYRAAQEAMTNVLKHAGASRVVITLNRLIGYVSVIIEDDGKGFDGEAAMDSPSAHAGLGLLGMRERVESVGGTLEIESGPGMGTSLLIRIPIEAPGEAGPHGVRSGCSWPRTMRSSARASGPCSTPSRTWRSSARRPTATRRSPGCRRGGPTSSSWISRCPA